MITANAALFTGDETRRIEQAIGAASTAAELLGRVRVQRYSDLIDHWGRDAYSMGPLEQFSAFPQFTTLQNALHYLSAAEYDGDWELADDLDDDLTELGGEIWATELELKLDHEPQYA